MGLQFARMRGSQWRPQRWGRAYVGVTAALVAFCFLTERDDAAHREA